jgi:predicted DNA-binding protein
MAHTPAGKFKLELHPLPTRVSKLAIARLNALRDHDGMTIQEHVRRAVDDYLDRVETKYARQSQKALAVAPGEDLQSSPAADETPLTPVEPVQAAAAAATMKSPYAALKVR